MSRHRRPEGVNWWRLWSLQGSFNSQRMQGLGWLVAMSGVWARRGLDAEAARAQLLDEPTSANTHPYLVGLALGARLRLEEEGEVAQARRVSDGLERALGGIGDRLIWVGVVPFVGVLALGALGVVGPWAVLGIWLAFAGAQAWLRRRLLFEGYRRGAAVLTLLEDRRTRAATSQLGVAGALLSGLVGGLVLSRALDSSAEPFATAAAVAIAGTWGVVCARWRMRPEAWALGLALVAGVVSGLSHVLS
jgi:mannose/fructose/N-acetylgalactosamine-specific phosphotransferase system component IID